MTLKESIYTHLSLAASVTNLVPATKIFPQLIPQEVTPPCITFRVISGATPGTHDGSSGINLGARFEITAWAEKSSDADRIRLAIQLLLKSFRGNLGGTGVYWINVSTAGPRDLYDPVSRLFGSQVDFLGTYKEDTES